jgi:hypothetical protein
MQNRRVEGMWLLKSIPSGTIYPENLNKDGRSLMEKTLNSVNSLYAGIENDHIRASWRMFFETFQPLESEAAGAYVERLRLGQSKHYYIPSSGDDNDGIYHRWKKYVESFQPKGNGLVSPEAYIEALRSRSKPFFHIPLQQEHEDECYRNDAKLWIIDSGLDSRKANDYNLPSLIALGGNNVQSDFNPYPVDPRIITTSHTLLTNQIREFTRQWEGKY